MTWAIPSLRSEKFRKPEPPKKVFLSKNVIFRGLRLSLGHFGQQAPKSPVSQLQNGVSTSFLPPVILGILTFKDYPRSNSFFSMGILEGVKWKTSQAAYNGPKEQWYKNLKKGSKITAPFCRIYCLDPATMQPNFAKQPLRSVPNFTRCTLSA